MAIYGRIDCLIPAADAPAGELACNMFRAVWGFLKELEDVGVTTEVARNNGRDVGSGTGWFGEANKFGTSAWAVFRFNVQAGAQRQYPWYLLLQWGRYTMFGNADNYWARIQGEDVGNWYNNFGIQAVRGLGGDENPWLGSSDLGAATRPLPFWGTPTGGTGVQILPRRNRDNANKHDTAKIIGQDQAAQTRLHLLTNGDGLLLVYGSNDTADGYRVVYAGPTWVPDPAKLEPPLALITCAATYNAWPWSPDTNFGSSYDNDGGIAFGGIASPKTVRTDRYRYVQQAQPNQLVGIGYDEWRIPVCPTEEVVGFAGWLPPDLMTETWGVGKHATTPDLTKCFIANNTSTNPTLIIPWNGVTVPGTTATRDGVWFQR